MAVGILVALRPHAHHRRYLAVMRPAELDEWLAAQVADGPVLVAAVQAAAAERGVSDGQLRRARVRLALVSTRVGYSSDGGHWLSRAADVHLVRERLNPQLAAAAEARRQASAEARALRDETLASIASGMEHPGDLFRLTDPQRAFLVAFAQSGVVAHAARAADVSREVVYLWKRSVPAFAEAMRHAYEDSTDRLELQAVAMATRGVTKEVVTPVGVVEVRQAPSERMVAFLLRARRPELYDRKASTEGADVLADDDLDVIRQTLFGGGADSEALHDALAEMEELFAPGADVTEGDAGRVLQRIDDALGGVVEVEAGADGVYA